MGAPPQTAWEATHQGHAAAEEERRRLDLGSSPIRDVAETLATLRMGRILDGCDGKFARLKYLSSDYGG